MGSSRWRHFAAGWRFPRRGRQRAHRLGAEANSAGLGKRRFYLISDGVAQGVTISESLEETRNWFPEFFRQLVHVGESTGHLPEVFRQLADHYEHQLRVRRSFIQSITWPLIELGLALIVVGIIILLMGMIPNSKTWTCSASGCTARAA